MIERVPVADKAADGVIAASGYEPRECGVSRRVPVITIAGCYALGAFTIAVVSGLWVGREASEILSAALVSLSFCYVIGLLVGKAASVAVREHVERRVDANTAPESSEELASLNHAEPAPAVSG